MKTIAKLAAISVLLALTTACATVSGDQAFPLGPQVYNVTDRTKFEADRSICSDEWRARDRQIAMGNAFGGSGGSTGVAIIGGLLGPIGVIAAGTAGAIDGAQRANNAPQGKGLAARHNENMSLAVKCMEDKGYKLGPVRQFK